MCILKIPRDSRKPQDSGCFDFYSAEKALYIQQEPGLSFWELIFFHESDAEAAIYCFQSAMWSQSTNNLSYVVGAACVLVFDAIFYICASNYV